MRKEIAKFRDESYGLFIDLAPDGGRIGVDRLTGDVLLDEGDGDDRFQGAAIDARTFRQFELAKDEHGLPHVVLHYGEGDQHGLGITNDLAAAQAWISNANELIKRLKRRLPPHSAPQLQEKVSIFSDAVRAVHPPVNYGKFEPRPELDRLTKWARGSKRLCIISGSGGSGKSTLATQFMLTACPGSIAGYRESRTPFDSAFYFSFYDDPSPETFLRTLSRWLRPETAAAPKSAAMLITMLRGAGSSLIVLDGFEAARNNVNKRVLPRTKLLDLLKRVGEGQSGKVRVLVTARDHRALTSSVRSEIVVLNRLPTASAISLLRSRGVDGDDKTLRKFAHAVGYQPLALDMAGHCIREFGWQDTWSNLIAERSSSRVQSSQPVLDFKTIAGDFLHCLFRAAPRASEILGQLCESTSRSSALSWKRSDEKETLLWCFDLLARSSLMTSFAQRSGYVGAASGGTVHYQFEPLVRLERHSHRELMIQSLKVPSRFEVNKPRSDAICRRNRAPAWLRSVVFEQLKRLEVISSG